MCSKSFIHSLWGISKMPHCIRDLQMKYSQEVPRGAHYLSLTVTNRFGLSSPSVVTNGFLKIFETTEVPGSSAEIFAVKRIPYACPCWKQLLFAIKKQKQKKKRQKKKHLQLNHSIGITFLQFQDNPNFASILFIPEHVSDILFSCRHTSNTPIFKNIFRAGSIPVGEVQNGSLQNKNKSKFKFLLKEQNV